VARTRPDDNVSHAEEHAGVAVGSDFLADKEAERWQRLLTEKVATIVKVRGLELPDAEREGFEQVVIENANETHPNSGDPHVCAWCRKPSLPLAPTLPFGVDGRCTWLHSFCHEAWTARRRAEVVAAFAKMGIVEPGGRDE
jgi:hypothetical protein